MKILKTNLVTSTRPKAEILQNPVENLPLRIQGALQIKQVETLPNHGKAVHREELLLVRLVLTETLILEIIRRTLLK